MAEQVIRHRGGGRDEDGVMIPSAPTPLTARVVAPGGGYDYTDRARSGETVDYTVYFALGVDLLSSDELTVRGKRCSIVVNEWNKDGRGGLEVLCTRGQG